MELFDKGYGVTRQSIDFYRENKSKFSEFKTAVVTDYEAHNCAVTVPSPDGIGTYCYPLTLTDNDGNKMYLSGVCSGYYGEGPRGLHTILTEAGFKIDMDFIGGHTGFELSK